MYTLIESGNDAVGFVFYKSPCGQAILVAKVEWGKDIKDTMIEFVSPSFCTNTLVQVTKLIQSHFE